MRGENLKQSSTLNNVSSKWKQKELDIWAAKSPVAKNLKTTQQSFQK